MWGYFVIEHLDRTTLETILNVLPIELSFIDKNDEVKFFNKNGDRIFLRPRNVIGKKVQNCHPLKSLQKVVQIIDAFKSEEKDSAEFWIDFKGMKVYIRYFPIRNDKGEYLGTLEVSQNITGLKKLEGEKRLVDWE